MLGEIVRSSVPGGPMPESTRRDFLATAAHGSAALAAAGLVAPALAGPRRRSALDSVNIGLVGCGGRGSGAANDSLSVNPEARLVAMADLDPTRAKSIRDQFKGDHGERIDVPDERIHGGLDGFRKVIEDPSVDLVILATSPGFRPQHIEAAVQAGKHVFAEKPTCVDVAGWHSNCRMHDLARSQGTAIVTGTQYRRQKSFMEAIDRIRQGMIGEVVSATARYCSNGIWYRERKPGMSDLEYQLHNWMHFIWLSGDQPVEQAVHNIDALCWIMGGPPEAVFATGSRWDRPADSEMWDSFAFDYRWPGGRTASFTGRHWPNSTNEFDNVVYGSEGIAYIRAFNDGARITDRAGKELWSMPGDIGAAYRQEHKDLVESIKAGKPIVELRETADSSLAAVMGREAAYSGTATTWEYMTNRSRLDLFPKSLGAGGPVPKPFVRKPGAYRLS
jgi:predicted dehydrogenase